MCVGDDDEVYDGMDSGGEVRCREGDNEVMVGGVMIGGEEGSWMIYFWVVGFVGLNMGGWMDGRWGW